MHSNRRRPHFFVFAALGSLLVLTVLAGAVAAQEPDPPPRSDTITAFSQFLLCTGNPYALCYYSGPEHAPPKTRQPVPALPCVLEEGGKVANCKCYAFADGTSENYVASTSILNPEIRQATATACGDDGLKCLNMINQKTCAAGEQPEPCKSDPKLGNCCQTAPVCEHLGNVAQGTGQSFLPGATLLSTFSFEHAGDYPIGSTDCSDEPYDLYAGCMTAPCGKPYSEDGQQFVDCACPTYRGPFQFGQDTPGLVDGESPVCGLKKGYVWSAANLVTSASLASQVSQDGSN